MTDVINAWLQEFETNSDAKDQNKALADLLANDLASRAEAAAPLRQAMIRLIRCTIRPGQDGQLSLSLQLTDESLQRINAWTGWLADYRACQRDFGQDNVKLDMLVGRLVGQKVPAKTRAARGRFDWIISRLMLFCVFIPFAFGRGLWGRRAVLDNC